MAEYWGASAVYHSGGPRGEGTRYILPPYESDVEFTRPPAEDNGTTIETIRQQVLGQHPEDISLLADMWQNAYNLLHSVHQQLLSSSTELHDETWKSPQARDAFLRTGPGKTLAYLDEWMDAALNNVAALRAAVGIARDSRARMEQLWSEYEAAIDDAKTADAWTRGAHGALWGVTLTLYDADKGIQAAEAEAVQEKQKEYNRKAQQLAHEVAGEYFDTMSKVSGGHGPPFFPMDAVLNVVGHPPWRGPVGAPPAPGMAPPPPGARLATPPAVRSVPRVAPTDPRELERKVLEGLNKPPVAPTTVPSVDGAPTTTAPPAVAPPPVALPVAPPPRTGLTAPPGLSQARAAGAGLVRPPGADSLRGAERGALRNGVLRAGGTPAVAEPPQAALRSPGANATPPPAGGRGMPPALRSPGATSTGAPPGMGQGMPPAGARGPGAGATSAPPAGAGGRPGASGSPHGQRGTGVPGRPTVGAADPFGRAPAATTPPVLQNRRPEQARPGVGLSDPTRGGGPVPGRPGTAPPVLGSPAKGAPTPPATGPGRTGRGGPDRTARKVPPGSEWVGDGQPETTAPVLDAPAAPATGSRLSRLEEVPKALRGQPSGTRARPARGGATVPPELAPRRTSEAAPAARRGDEEEREIVTDERAFSVETPGGGVLGKQAEDRSYRVEPKTALGGN